MHILSFGNLADATQNMPIRERKIRKLTQVDREARAVSVVSGSMLRPRILGPLISLGELEKKKKKENSIVRGWMFLIYIIYMWIYSTHQDRKIYLSNYLDIL